MSNFTPFFGTIPNLNSSTGGGISTAIDFGAIDTDPKANQLPRGAYLVKITEVKVNPLKKRGEFLIDVAQGPEQGFFKKHPGAPSFLRTLYLSYEPSRLMWLKLDLSAIGSHNAGFDPFNAWNTDAQSFVGKRIGLTVSYNEKRDGCGEVGSMPSYRLVHAGTMAAGAYRIPGNVALDGTRGPDDPGIPLSFSENADDGHDSDDLWGDIDD